MTKAEIQLVRSLDDKRARAEAGLFVAEGEKLVRELMASDFRVRKVFFTKPAEDYGGLPEPPLYTGFPDFEGWPGNPGFAGFPGADERITPKEMGRISHLKTPTDVLALVEIPRRGFEAAAMRGRLVLALDEVQNPGNLGTIIRLADWFGITDIMCSEGAADCFNPKVVQATMGAITRVALHYGDLAEMIAGVGSAATEIAGAGLPVYGTFLEGENIYDASLTPEGVIVMGSEGRGISAGVERLVTRKLFIPPCNSSAESLNVAVAAAIVCSEFRRR